MSLLSFFLWSHTAHAAHGSRHCGWHQMGAAEERVVLFCLRLQKCGPPWRGWHDSRGPWCRQDAVLLWLEPSKAALSVHLCSLGHSPKGSTIFQKSTTAQGPNAQKWACELHFIFQWQPLLKTCIPCEPSESLLAWNSILLCLLSWYK